MIVDAGSETRLNPCGWFTAEDAAVTIWLTAFETGRFEGYSRQQVQCCQLNRGCCVPVSTVGSRKEVSCRGPEGTVGCTGHDPSRWFYV